MKNLSKTKLTLVCIIAVAMIALCFGTLLTTTNTAHAETAVSSDLYFSLNSDKTGYSVSALNKKLIEADIPETYNGLPVTEIATNGFVSCPNLVKVTVPQSVKKVNNSAFTNCKQLKSIVGMAGVTSVGNNAFAMCPQLDDLVLPSTITSLRDSVSLDGSITVKAPFFRKRLFLLVTLI